jgi:predicted flap endonuclease-1-like 5' DNA nuclease
MARRIRSVVIFLLLSIAGLLALLFWWWLQRHPEEEVILKTKIGTVSRPRVVERPAPSVRSTLFPRDASHSLVEGAPADDLKRIKGIGPKISGVLQAASINTFAQLAETDVERLKQILIEAGVRLTDPGTWPQQAGLAAAGDWEALKRLQDELKGGRRV